MMRFARLACPALVVLVTLSLGAASSRANPPVAPYLNTASAVEDALWYRVSVTGAAWPDTFPASWAAPSTHKVSVAAQALPALRAVGTLWLGATAFELGWKIGRVIDTKWLHLSGPIGVQSPTSDVVNERWLFTGIGASGPQNVWVLTMNTTMGSQDFCNGCATRSQWGWDYQQQILGSVSGAQAYDAGPASCGIASGVCRYVYVPEAAMEAAVIHSVPEPYTTQPFGKTTNIPAPVKNATNLAAARSKITELGEAIQNEYNASLDYANWARPGANGSPPGGFITDWTMPDCWSLTETACVTAIDAAAAAANNALPTISSVPASDDYSDLWLSPGVALSTSPALGTMGRPSSVTIITNQDPLPAAGGDRGGGSGGDGNSTTTTGDEDQCDFDRDHSIAADFFWADALELDRAFYEEACQEAWNTFWSELGVSPGNLPQAVIDGARVMHSGQRMSTYTNPNVVNPLTAGGRSLSDWQKVTTTHYTTPSGRMFQIHFYRYTGSQPAEAMLTVDFKVRFLRIFYP